MTTEIMPVVGDDSLPRNLEAEQAVLGSLLLDRDAIIEVSQILQPDDFTLNAHVAIYRVMSALYEQSVPVDFVTVLEEIERRDLLERAGGRGYLTELVNVVPTAIHVEHYARIVERLSILRRLISAGAQIMGIAQRQGIEADDAISQSEDALLAVAQRRSTSGFMPIHDILANILERLDYVHENRGAIVGVPTGFIDLDKLLGGLQRSDLVILGARPAHGKCLTADTLIDDPLTGERVTIERFVREKRPFVSGMACDGSVETKAIGAWIDSGVKPCFLVRTRTGREVKVTGHHPFFTVKGWTPLHDLSVGSAIAVPAQLPVFGTNTDMPHDLVRLLAYYIAEGSISATKTCPGFTNVDPVLMDDFTAIIGRWFPTCAIRRYGIDYYVSQPRSRHVPGTGAIMPPNPVRHWLEAVGVYGERAEGKSFPACVWTWNRPTLALFLRVLMSCDGSIHANRGRPRIEFAVASQNLASDVQHALLRFGIVSFRRRKTERCWSVVIIGDREVGKYQREIGWIGEKAARFADWVPTPARNGGNAGHLPAEMWPEVKQYAANASLSLVEVARRAGETSKAGKHAGYNAHCSRGLPMARAAAYARVLQWPELRTASNPDMYWDEIVHIEPIGEHQVYDLTVPDGSNFVANGVFVHNTALALGLCHNASVRYKQNVAVFSLEMSKEQLVQRLLCMQGRLDSGRLRSGYIDEEEWTRLIEAAAVLSEAKIFIDDSAGITPGEMRNRARRLQAEQGLDLIVVDYLQLMQGRATENRVQEISGISRALKVLARELNVPVMALSQVSRGVDSRTSHVPLLSDLRESGCLTGDTPIYLPDQGTYRPISELVGQAGFHALALNTETWRLEPAVVSRAFATGVKPVYRLTTRLGRTIRATTNHKFLTLDGWKRLDDLSIGEPLATPDAPTMLERQSSNGRYIRGSVPATNSPSLSCTYEPEPTAGYPLAGVVVLAMRPQSPMAPLSRRTGGSHPALAGAVPAMTFQGQVVRYKSPVADVSDVYWDEIASIEPDGEAAVYDLTVDNLHNFVAGDIIAHNSIEQDADVVIFLCREEMYDPETEKRHIADIYVAKHRNGPTGHFALYFDQQQTRFRDLETQAAPL